ncbi:MAG: hypothetical protein Q8M02_05695 [Candidatus Didemnitutus sp.]|nr:hypothetical protein [Candidatus Didemnitutus sp.]
MNTPRLLLVYNADSGLFNAAAGWAHKLISPETYACSLCKITYGHTGMLRAWQTYLAGQPFPTAFLYRDTFQERYPDLAEHPLPLILVEDGPGVEILLEAADIEVANGLATLITEVEAALADWRSQRG